VATTRHPIFGLHMPISVKGVPSSVLNPRDSWTDKNDYDARALELAQMFSQNFAQFEVNIVTYSTLHNV
jgi:phosphoenolpyruvate carboxykinase (ATP)